MQGSLLSDFAAPAASWARFAAAADSVPWIFLISLSVVPIFTAEDAFRFKVQGKFSLVPFSVTDSAVSSVSWRGASLQYERVMVMEPYPFP